MGTLQSELGNIATQTAAAGGNGQRQKDNPMNKTDQITKNVRAIFRMINLISYAGFTELAPAITPIAPASFFALAIGTAIYIKLIALGWPSWMPLMAET